MKIVHAMIVVQDIKIAHTMRVVQVMKIVHAIMVVQDMKIAHALIVVQVMKIVRAMKAIRKVMNGRASHKSHIDYAGKKVMRLGTELEDSFRDDDFQILHCLQSSRINTSLSGHTEATSHPPIPSAHFLSRKLRGKPANKDPYQVGRMKLRLPKLQVEEQEVRKLKAGLGSPYQVGEMRLRL